MWCWLSFALFTVSASIMLRSRLWGGQAMTNKCSMALKGGSKLKHHWLKCRAKPWQSLQLVSKWLKALAVFSLDLICVFNKQTNINEKSAYVQNPPKTKKTFQKVRKTAAQEQFLEIWLLGNQIWRNGGWLKTFGQYTLPARDAFSGFCL